MATIWPGVIRVVVVSGRDFHIRRRLFKPLEESGDIIDTVFIVLREHVGDEPGEAALEGAGLGHHGEIRRSLAAIGRRRFPLVAEGADPAIGQFPRTLETSRRTHRDHPEC